MDPLFHLGPTTIVKGLLFIRNSFTFLSVQRRFAVQVPAFVFSTRFAHAASRAPQSCFKSLPPHLEVYIYISPSCFLSLLLSLLPFPPSCGSSLVLFLSHHLLLPLSVLCFFPSICSTVCPHHVRLPVVRVIELEGPCNQKDVSDVHAGKSLKNESHFFFFSILYLHVNIINSLRQSIVFSGVLISFVVEEEAE